ncbi:MAG: glycine--tRNA ligase subunit beta [Candidatus Firestonebacteria bacterium]
MSKDLLIELGVEEIPAKQLLGASEQFAEGVKKALTTARIAFKKCEVFATPRRLGLLFSGVDEGQQEQEREVVGPPKRVAYDAEGKPTQAALGFAKTNNAEVSELTIKVLPKGEYICVVRKEKGIKTEKLLPELISRQIAAINWQKTMKWAEEGRFVRPIRSLLLLFGRKTVKTVFSDVVSGNISYGHRTLSPRAVIVTEPSKFKAQMKKHFVLLSYAERRELTLKEVASAMKGVPGKVLLDEELVEEITNLVEYPSALLGKFDTKYLAVPEEVLIEVMKKNQKYFPVLDETGKLLPYFVCVRNGSKLHNNIVKEGNERVLRARFEDAAFFFNEDKKTRLSDRIEKLKNVVFQVELGSVYEKIQRMSAVYDRAEPSFKGTESARVKRALSLCKADLVTDMIREFPELQGVMGREYAKLDGEDSETASAIAELYLPKFSGDSVPSTATGSVVSILDKLDTLTGCFAIGLIPTGSQDPYGLRRNTLGVVSIVLQRKLDLSLKDLVKFSLESYGAKVKADAAKVQKDILEFFKARMQVLLAEKGIRYDIVNAVLGTDCSNILDTFARAGILNELAKEASFNKVIVTFSRVINILPKEGSYAGINTGLFKEEAEKTLYDFVKSREKTFYSLIENKKYAEAFKITAEFLPVIDNLFDRIMIMDKDPAIKENRLALLNYIGAMFLEVGDYSKIMTK